MTIVLLEPHPLIRVGLQQLIGQMALPVHTLAPERVDPDALMNLALDIELLILGIPADWAAARELTAHARRRLRPRSILLICPPENAWSASGVEIDNVYCCVPSDASPLTLQAAIRMGLGREPWREDDPPAGSACPCSGADSPGQAMHPDPPVAALAEGLATEGFVSQVSVPNDPVFDPESHEGTLRAREMQRLDLTERQYDVLVRMGRGEPIKTIARHLGISPATARAHASAIYQRLGVRSKGEAVHAARCKGALLAA
ncbi:response regulator transcription factor [Achromobacter sp. GG226]|uniref:response regulator transcription factor n=1 Tax=Verticiella alkaliphila TaxID=2779529 RepID=UPI001C0B99CD|nr:LuxR C-terminal-related transcriptional regulator [Verticiella sp. GG226]MBU4613069.1 response regulator transcription factor [Verticiella sp. GG226]